MIETKEMVDFAQEIAYRYHLGQKDKVGKPYFLHPFMVAYMVETDEEKIVAFLHDVIEDTEYTEEMLREDFPEKIADAVMAMTHKEDEKYDEYIKRVAKNRLARKVKIADMKHNADLTRYPDPQKSDKDRSRMYEKRLKTLLAIDERIGE